MSSSNQRRWTGLRDELGEKIYESMTLELDVAKEKFIQLNKNWLNNTTEDYKPVLGTIYFDGGCFQVRTHSTANIPLHSIAYASRVWKEQSVR